MPRIKARKHPPAGRPETRGGNSVPVACDRCGSDRTQAVFSTLDYMTEERFAILRCDGCGLHRTEWRQRQDSSVYYGPAYYGDAGRRFGGTVERLVALFRRARAREVARRAQSPGRILDLGCGRGLMLAALSGMGWECVGTETSVELAQAAFRSHGLRVVPAGDPPLPFPDASLDAVTSWHTLEHMEHPVRMLADVHRVLKPGALLVIEVPNFSSIQAQLGGPRWFHLDAPRHLYHFRRAELRAILARLGFRILEEGTLSLEYGPFGMAQTLLNKVTFRSNALYRALKRNQQPDPSNRPRSAGDLFLSLLLALPAGAAGTALELLAALAGRGGVARYIARKESTR